MRKDFKYTGLLLDDCMAKLKVIVGAPNTSNVVSRIEGALKGMQLVYRYSLTGHYTVKDQEGTDANNTDNTDH